MARALVAGEVLRWARESRGLSLDEAARKLRIPVERLTAWESGDAAPTVKQVRKIATQYKRPVGILYLSEPPDPEELIRDFRRMPEAEELRISPELLLEMRLARERRLEAVELAGALDQVPAPFNLRATLDTDPDELAVSVRELLGVSTGDQLRWPSSRDAFNAWSAAVEQAGVLVFQTGGKRGYTVDPNEARGFAIADQPLPVVVANGSDAPTARCFTLAHELVHVVLATSGLCDQHEFRRPTTLSDRFEVYCNRVAGAVLVPGEALQADPDVQGQRDQAPEWEDVALERIARRFRVSPEVVLRRLLIIGRTTHDYYEHWRASRPERETSDASGFLTPPLRVIKRNGRGFSRLVLRAYEEGQIGLADIVDILEIGPQHLESVEAMAFVSGS